MGLIHLSPESCCFRAVHLLHGAVTVMVMVVVMVMVTVTVTVTVMLMLMLLMLSVCCQARVRREHPRPFGLVAFGGPFGLVTLGDGAIRYPGGDRQLVVSDTALSAVSPNFKDATLSKKSSISSIASNSWTS